MGLSISAERDALENTDIYIKNAHLANTENHMMPEKARRGLRERRARANPGRPHDLERPRDAWYHAIVEYIKEFVYKIKEYIPREDHTLWTFMGGHTSEYFQAVKTRDEESEQGKALKRHYPMGNRERGELCRPRLYPQHARNTRTRRRNRRNSQRMESNPHGRRLRPDNAENPDADELDAETTGVQKDCHRTCQRQGRAEIIDWAQWVKYGRLLINTEASPCVQRSRSSIDAIRKSRI